MDLEKYQKLCKRTAKPYENQTLALSNWGLGLVGEAGDVGSCIKKVIFHKNDGLKEGIKENLGDMMWYVSMICNEFGWSLKDVLNENFEKLKKRFPEGFDAEKIKRDGTMIKWSGQK